MIWIILKQTKIHAKIFLVTILDMWQSKNLAIKTNSVNPLYLISNKVNGYFEGNNGNKYLRLVSINVNCGVKSDILLGNN